MPRSPRVPSASNIYHVMIRGINHQQIFEDNYDYIQFIKILYELIPICEFSLFAFCLMGNHVHLLIRVENTSLSDIMKRLETRYVHWYNLKYDRQGHLFENRYKSEPVEDESYLLTVLRYILQNPVKAGICDKIYQYPWSSANAYLAGSDAVICVSEIRVYFNSLHDMKLFLNSNNDDDCMEDLDPITMQTKKDKHAWDVISSITNCHSTSQFQQIEIAKRNEYICDLKELISIRQLARLLGLSKTQIQRIVARANTAQ